MERLPILVYAATGFTGALVCEELDRQGVSFAIGGRDPDRLARLAARLKTRPRVFVAGVDDTARLRQAAAAARVLVSCAGPFVRYGRQVQDVALAEGAHWLDTSGEWPHLCASFERDQEARAAGVALVGAVGVDVVPSDIAAFLASEGMEAPSLRIAVGSAFGGTSQGTTRSTVEVVARGGRVVVSGQLVEEPIGARRWEVRMPEPFGICVAVSAPLPDLATAPRTTGAKSVVAFQPPSALRDRVLERAPWIVKLAGTRLVHAALDRLVGLSSDGPDATARTKSRYAAVVEATSVTGERRVAEATSGDGYELTASIVAWCARKAADPSFDKRGALSPVQAFGARELLEALTPAGLRVSLR
jgi:short subunit dehydrogenase-like uncharacterized protein